MCFPISRPRVPWRTLITLGLLLGAGQYGLMFIAISTGMPAGLAAVLVHTQAVFTVLIAIIFFKERPTTGGYLSLGVATAGLVCLLLDRIWTGTALGFALMLLAALSAAIGNIVIKSTGQTEMIRLAVWMSVAPLVPLALLSLLLEGGGSLMALADTVTPRTLGAVAYSAVFSTVVAYAIWGRLLVDHPAGHVAPYFLLVPAFGLGLSALVLGETLSPLQIIGSALVFLGFGFSTFIGKRSR